MASVAHEIRQFRYVTSLQRQLPWAHLRHVSVADLRHDAPDLPLMANLIAELADCGISLPDVRNHSDSDLLQLVLVLQACLQFTLWSQNVLKEKMLELQSSQVARRVTAKQLDHVEARCSALVKDVTSLTGERDTLSLGNASLRTSLVQLETTVRMQERQIKQERERTAQLLAQLERAFAERIPTHSGRHLSAPRADAEHRPDGEGESRSGMRCPTCGHRTRTTAAATRHHHRRRRAAADHIDDASSVSTHDATSTTTATSYSDSMLGADAAALFEARRYQQQRSTAGRKSAGQNCCRGDFDPCGGASEGFTPVYPAPCLDWRTLVRYIVHEEKNATPAWGKTAVPAIEAANTAVPSPGASQPTPRAAAAVHDQQQQQQQQQPIAVVAPDVADQIRGLFMDFTSSMTAAVSDYACGTATQTRELISAMTRQRLQETTDAQHALLQEAQALLKNVSSVSAATTRTAATTLALAPVSSSSSAAAAAPERAQAPSSQPQHTEAAVRPLSSPLRLTSSPVIVPGNRLAPPATSDSSKEAVAHFMRSISEHSSDKFRGSGSFPLSHPDVGTSLLQHRSDMHSPPSLSAAPPSLFNSLATSPLPETRGPPSTPALHRTSSAVTARGGEDNSDSLRRSRSSLLPAFSPSILRTPVGTPDASNNNTSSRSSISNSAELSRSMSLASSHNTSAHSPPMDHPLSASAFAHARVIAGEEQSNSDSDEQPPDADFRLPSTSSASSNRRGSSADSYQSSPSRANVVPRTTGWTAAATPAPASALSRAATTATTAPGARPRSTPPVYPGMGGHQHPQQAASPLTMSPPVTAFAMYRTASLHSSMRSDNSGLGSTHASSQMLRDTQRELEALLAEDAAAERAKTQR